MLTLDSIQIGDTAACGFVATEDRIRSFAEFSSDTNPLHLDADAARASGFPRQVAHGMLVLSAVSRLIGTELPGPGALWLSHDMRFLEPVFMGDRVTARVTVERVSKATGIVVLRTDAFNADTEVAVLAGMAKVRVPQGPQNR